MQNTTSNDSEMGEVRERLPHARPRPRRVPPNRRPQTEPPDTHSGWLRAGKVTTPTSGSPEGTTSPAVL